MVFSIEGKNLIIIALKMNLKFKFKYSKKSDSACQLILNNSQYECIYVVCMYVYMYVCMYVWIYGY